MRWQPLYWLLLSWWCHVNFKFLLKQMVYFWPPPVSSSGSAWWNKTTEEQTGGCQITGWTVSLNCPWYQEGIVSLSDVFTDTLSFAAVFMFALPWIRLTSLLSWFRSCSAFLVCFTWFSCVIWSFLYILSFPVRSYDPRPISTRTLPVPVRLWRCVSL